jgi:hypothetical protein
VLIGSICYTKNNDKFDRNSISEADMKLIVVCPLLSWSAYCPILFITHQLPKGLQVDEAVILGKEKSNSESQQSTVMQSSQQSSVQQPNSEKVKG